MADNENIPDNEKDSKSPKTNDEQVREDFDQFTVMQDTVSENLDALDMQS
jgi:hypothetical protein